MNYDLVAVLPVSDLFCCACSFVFDVHVNKYLVYIVRSWFCNTWFTIFLCIDSFLIRWLLVPATIPAPLVVMPLRVSLGGGRAH